jgi:general nucleoside transport system permease protein
MVPQTDPIAPSAALPRLLQGTQLSAGIFLGLGCAVAAWFILRRTLLGYEVRAVGLNPTASATAGIRTARTLVLTLAIAGAFAGVGGAVEILGVHARFIQGFSPGFGYDGIAVAVLANNHPLGLLPTAFLFGALRAGAAGMGRETDVPSDFAVLLQGLIIIFAAAPFLFRTFLRGRR